jgi:glutamate synthase domain-containing protein 3
MSNAVRIEAGERPIREVNLEIRQALVAGHEVVVTNTLSRHNLGVGLPSGAKVRFEGSVGYYCGGLNNGAVIDITRDCGWAVGEAMAAGEITVGGYAGMSVGASMRGGLIHVKGDAGPRCGVAIKGGDIIVEGRIGYLSGFMGHVGRIIALGGAGDACGDSLWGGEVWVAGPIGSLGVDAKLAEPEADEVEALEKLLSTRGLDDRQRDWRKIVSAQKLWHFTSRDAGSWLMI